MSTSARGLRFDRGMPWQMSCGSGCGRRGVVAIDTERIAVIDDQRAAAQQAFAALGWVKFEALWRCPSCWVRIVNARGPGPEVYAALRSRGAMMAIVRSAA